MQDFNLKTLALITETLVADSATWGKRSNSAPRTSCVLLLNTEASGAEGGTAYLELDWRDSGFFS